SAIFQANCSSRGRLSALGCTRTSWVIRSAELIGASSGGGVGHGGIGQSGEDVVQAGPQMQGGGLCCQGAVAVGDRLGDDAVLPGSGHQAGVIVVRQSASAGHLRAQGDQCALDRGAVHRGIQGGVQVCDQVVVAGVLGVLGGQ